MSSVADKTSLPQEVTSENFHVVEAKMYASVFDKANHMLLTRLKSMTNNWREFKEHEIVYTLRCSTVAKHAEPIIRMRRQFSSNTTIWQVQCLDIQDIDEKCPAVIHRSINSIAYSPNIMEFVKTMNFILNYEYLMNGHIFIFDTIKVLVYKVVMVSVPGRYARNSLIPVSESLVVEASILVESKETMYYAEQLKTFCDQFEPFIKFTKVDCYRSYVNKEKMK